MYKFIFKRLFDLLISFIALLVLSPIMLMIIILLVFFNKGSGVFFRQTRTGKNLTLFKIYKFKTMADTRDAIGKLLPDEDRTSGLGRFLRSTSMDEFPQFLNVFLGQMSLIGPRPLLEKYIPLYSQEQTRRHEVKPGISGWAQCNGRNAITWSEKFKLDVWYVDNISFVTDIKIIIFTIKNVVQRKDITSDDSKKFEPFNGNN
jgi:lipopolysaccharide/colanic/teichoic acid biosynthesis glycosyltransferase